MDAQEYIKANVLEAEEAQEYAEKCLETALQDIETLKKQNDAGDELEEMVEKCRDGVYRSKRLADSFHEGVSKRDEYYKKIVGELKQGIETLQKQVTANCSGLLKAERDTYKKQNEKLKREKVMVLKQNKQLQKCYAAAQRETDIEHVRYLDEQVKVGALKEDLKRVMKERNYLGDYVGGATSDEEEDDQ